MKLYILLLLTNVLALSVSGARFRTKPELHKKAEEKPQFISINLKKNNLDDDSRSKLFTFISQNQKMLSDLNATSNSAFIQKSQATTASVHAVRLSNYGNTQFTGKISIGDRNKEFDVIFDTGIAFMIN